MLTTEQYKSCIKTAVENPDGTTYVSMGKLEDGRDLCLVFSYEEGYGRDTEHYHQIHENGTIYTLCAKLAVNVDDLQCDFSVDWRMPWDKITGDVYDTCMAVHKGDEVEDTKVYQNEATELFKVLKSGDYEVV